MVSLSYSSTIKAISNFPESSVVSRKHENEVAVKLAYEYFGKFNKRNLRYYGKLILEDSALPREYQSSKSYFVISQLAYLLISVSFLIMSVKTIPWNDIFYFYVIPIPGITIYIIFFALILLVIYRFRFILIFWNSKLVIKADSIIFRTPKKKFELNYSNFLVIVTPMNNRLRFEIRSNRRILDMATIINRFIEFLPSRRRKEIYSTLVAKSIEYRNFVDTVGWQE